MKRNFKDFYIFIVFIAVFFIYGFFIYALKKEVQFQTSVMVQNVIKNSDLNKKNLDKLYKSQIIKKTDKIFLKGLILGFIVFVCLGAILFFILKKMRDSLRAEFEKFQTEFQKKYYYDKLTNLPNINKLLEDEKNALSLMILDIKNFSQINEIYGDKTSNEILKFVSKSLQELYENVYRIGDGKFAVLLNKILTLEEISIRYHTLFFNYNQFINITFVIGASNKKGHLLKTAKLALSYAFLQYKEYVLFDRQIEELQKEKYAKIKFLEDTLMEDKIIPFYQCIVNKKKEIIKYEALIRVVDGDKILAPNEFFEYAKNSNLYKAFSRNMIMKVINDLKSGVISKISINLSFEDMEDEMIRNIFYNFIDESISEKIVIEILESESIENFELVTGFILDMKKKGIKIAIDDFGSGYSNLVVVLALYPDYLKIDASLIKNINEPKYFDVIQMIVNFAHRYDIVVVAEYVDSQDVFEKLLKIGVDEFQGYYFCKPKPFEDIRKVYFGEKEYKGVL